MPHIADYNKIISYRCPTWQNMSKYIAVGSICAENVSSRSHVRLIKPFLPNFKNNEI
jgi:hypothetical protein